MRSISKPFRTSACLLAGFLLGACQSNSYTSSLSLSGVDHQRDVSGSVERLVSAQAAGEQAFEEAFAMVAAFTQREGELDMQAFDQILDSVDLCATHVAGQEQFLMQLEGAGRALFSEWDAELAQFSSERLRARSEGRMNEVNTGYEQLVVQSVRTTEQLESALVALRDYVLFFNHNLTPQAIQGLREDSASFEQLMGEVRAQVGASRACAQSFTASLHGAPRVGAQGVGPVSPNGAGS